MPYNNINELPPGVKDHVPEHGQEIYVKAFNNAWEEYKDPESRMGDASREETAHKVAWSAVKAVYKKDQRTGEWKSKNKKKEREKVPA
jgi:cation transport regulator